MTVPDFLCAGAQFPLSEALHERLGPQADIVILPIAAAFTGPTESAIAIAGQLVDQRVEALVVTDREGALTEHFALRVQSCDAVVLTDGSPLHLRTVVRGTPLLDALHSAPWIVTVGSVATVFGDPMIDPRGGAPTTGLGFYSDRVITVDAPTLSRSAELLGPSVTLSLVRPTTAWERRDGVWSEI